MLVWPVLTHGRRSGAHDDVGGYRDSRTGSAQVEKASHGCAKRPPSSDHRRAGVDVKLPFAMTGPETTAGKVFQMAKVVADILRLVARLSAAVTKLG